jgi:hypothetical protein
MIMTVQRIAPYRAAGGYLAVAWLLFRRFLAKNT